MKTLTLATIMEAIDSIPVQKTADYMVEWKGEFLLYYDVPKDVVQYKRGSVICSPQMRVVILNYITEHNPPMVFPYTPTCFGFDLIDVGWLERVELVEKLAPYLAKGGA